MATFVGVHGAMHGGWAWGPVRRLLQSEGHEMYTPTLTGQGDRAHLLSRTTGVETHVTDVVSMLEFEDVDDAVLVLHSYAGVLAGPIVELACSRIGSVIFAGAFYVRPGQSLMDVEPPETAEHYLRLAEQKGDGWRLPATNAFLEQWAVTDPSLKKFVGSRLTDFPLKAQTDRIDFDPAPLLAKKRTFIEHTAPPLASLAVSIEVALADGAEHRTIATGHDMMLADPQATSRLLVELAE